MANINLLPTDLAPKPSVLRVSGIIRKLTIAGVILLIVSIISAIGLFVIFSNQLRDSNARRAQLEASIKALEATEQKLVLIKNRLSLAKDVLARETATDELVAISLLIKSLPEGVTLNEANLEKDTTSTSVQAQDSQALTRMMATLIALGQYQQVDLLGISYSPQSGFSAEFELFKK